MARDLEGPVLRLHKEAKLHTLLGRPEDDRLEASGVCFKGGDFYVIFDNSPHIARIHPSLRVGHARNALLRQRGESIGFEDVTFHERAKRFLVILEAVPFGKKSYKPIIEEYDEDLRYVDSAWVDFELDGENKGIEGLCYFRRGREDFVLGLCEGNFCCSGKKGRKPGGGRIQVFKRGKGQWDHVRTLALPKSVRFEDYASLRTDGYRLAVVSQVSSALWVGNVSPRTGEIDGEGKTYLFPRDADGRIVYGNIEGVAWVTPKRLAFVSDKRKPGEQPKRHGKKDQSIHLFDLPE